MRLSLGALTLTLAGSSLVAQPNSDPWLDFIAWAKQHHGELGHRAASFLADHRPPGDRVIDAELLRQNLALALQARSEFPWVTQVPEQTFFNDVLPYAVLDETREDWRSKVMPIAKEIVAGCKTATEAAQALNREFFNRINVHYNTGRKKPNQSPAESIAQGRATCTGLSILLIDACRSVGVPARAAGVASWHDKRGNHTWVEVWDGGWHFTGADEFDAKGLDRGWFVGDARKAVAGDPRYAVWATSWQPTGAKFPMVWNRGDDSVHGVDVTMRYAPSKSSSQPSANGGVEWSVRVWDRTGGERVVAALRLLDREGKELGKAATRSGRADLNDMATVVLPFEQECTLEVGFAGETRSMPMRASAREAKTIDIAWNELAAEGLSRADAERELETAWRSAVKASREDYAKAIKDRAFVVGERKLRILERTFGKAPAGGHSLWISMHGGGGAPPRVNDQQWRNQIGLYEPKEGIYVAPRAPTDTWNLWHQAHIDELFDELIAAFVAVRGVDSDRVYLLGYSAGGDGVYQLAPRIADRFAAASMMAGHPNEAQPLGLRNLPFAIFMGGKDGAYRRNAVAQEWGEKLAALEQADAAGGYVHDVTIYQDCGHWMERRDAVALPWMAKHTRNPWPKRVVWFQDNVTHKRFYWLSVAPEDAVAGRTIRAAVEGQTIRIESPDTQSITLRLSDALIDLDREVVVVANGEQVFAGRVERTKDAITRSLAERADPRSAATASLHVSW